MTPNWEKKKNSQTWLMSDVANGEKLSDLKNK